jgi:glycosyltransferase involved in cell wall biosynthesis
MRVALVDPPAYTPPYDRCLAAALARAGVEVELWTSRFAHGEVPAPEGYAVREAFYRRSARLDGVLRRPARGAEHLGDMIRLRRGDLAGADLVHYQWLTFPGLDRLLLPAKRPRVLTPHGWLRREGAAGRGALGFRRLVEAMDAVVALSEYGARSLRARTGVDPARIHVIPHGAFDYLTRQPGEVPLPPELERVSAPVVLFFGLLRPYKGVDVLLDAFGVIEDAELWVVGRPLGIGIDGLAARVGPNVRLVPRFVPDREVPAFFRRADLVVLPYRDAEQSGVLFTALAFGKAIVLTDVGGFGEVAAIGAAHLVPPEDPPALAAAIRRLLGDTRAREELEAGARRAAAGPYSWDEVAARTIGLYRELAGEARP